MTDKKLSFEVVENGIIFKKGIIIRIPSGTIDPRYIDHVLLEDMFIPKEEIEERISK